MSVNPQVDALLAEGNWSAAINAFGVPLDRQENLATEIVRHAGENDLDPKRFRVFVQNDDPFDQPTWFLHNEGKERSLLLTMTRGNPSAVHLYLRNYSPVLCDMPDVCTCDERDYDDDDYFECDYCANGSDWCRHHNTYH